ncbi:MAG: heme o synthase [Corynebacterium pyruviciproducens]|uniref:heme o synthase n=1 Tax=Corynebacterium pyruviciproducens TaxID=598660 RepID=UPI0039831F28
MEGETFVETVKAYIALTKPRVIELLLIAAIPAMLQADRGTVHLGLIILTLIGGWMGAGAANTLNMVADYDIDQKMRRTEGRPLPKHSVGKHQALIFAVCLAIGSCAILWFLAHSLTAAIFILITIAWYIGIYTKWLKRRSSQNVVWGGAAGCMPVMVGWAVIIDNTAGPANWWQAVVLFMVIFFWTPPHTWALAMKYKEDYKAAGVPMLPVVAKPQAVTQAILIYTIATVITTLLLTPAAGVLYLAAAVLGGAAFIFRSWQLHARVRAGHTVHPFQLFLLANVYLSVVFIGLALDAVFLPSLIEMF